MRVVIGVSQYCLVCCCYVHIANKNTETITITLKVLSNGSRTIAHLPISLYYRVLSV